MDFEGPAVLFHWKRSEFEVSLTENLWPRLSANWVMLRCRPLGRPAMFINCPLGVRDFPLLNKWLQISHLIGKDKPTTVHQSLFYSLISVEDVISSSHLVWTHSVFGCAHFEGQTNGLFMHVFAQSCLMMACVGPMLWVLLLSRNNTLRWCLKYSWPGRPITLSHRGFLVVPSSPQFSYPLHVTVLHSLLPANLSASGCALHSRSAWSSKCHHQTHAHSDAHWNFIFLCYIYQLYSFLWSSAYGLGSKAFVLFSILLEI